MNRLRSVVAATFILIVILFLFVQHQDRLPEAYQWRRPFSHSGKNSTLTEDVPASPEDEALLENPSQPELDSPNAISPETPSLQDVPFTESFPKPSEPPSLGEAPELPPTFDLLPPVGPEPEPESDLQEFKPEFVFQQDLKLDLPAAIFKEHSTYKAHNYNPNGPKSYAYATFMATNNPSLKDPYYMAIHSLIYRILWSPRSASRKYPFIVFVADFVTREQRQLLAGAGAIVRELAPLEWNPNVEGIQHRWKTLFAKLNMWNQTDFDRILFLDADAFPVENIDDMFDISPEQKCIDKKLEPDDYLEDGTKVCEPYVFAGVPQDPTNQTDVNINVGSMVFTPSPLMHQRLLQNYVKFDRYNCLMAEQAFLNWQFNLNGAFPATMLQREWGGFFPQENEEGKLKVVHEKLWSWAEESSWLKQEWVTKWKEMLTFYRSEAFPVARKKAGTIFQ